MLTIDKELFLKLWESLVDKAQEDPDFNRELNFTNGMSDRLAEALESGECLATKYKQPWD